MKTIKIVTKRDVKELVKLEIERQMVSFYSHFDSRFMRLRRKIVDAENELKVWNKKLKLKSSSRDK